MPAVYTGGVVHNRCPFVQEWLVPRARPRTSPVHHHQALWGGRLQCGAVPSCTVSSQTMECRCPGSICLWLGTNRRVVQTTVLLGCGLAHSSVRSGVNWAMVNAGALG